MWGDGRGLETLFIHVIGEISWTDEREDVFDQYMADLRERRMFCETGLHGVLRSMLPGVEDLSDELTSIYAELTYRLGYLHLDRVLTSAEWSLLRQWFDQPLTGDLRLNDIKQQFGEPSFYTRGSWYQVHCYAGPDPADGWLCFDYGNITRSWSDESGGHFEWVYGDNYILRDRRRTAGKRDAMIELTPFGRETTG